jgi:hypothetical protein
MSEDAALWMWGIRQGEVDPGSSVGEFRNFVTGVTALPVRFTQVEQKLGCSE